MKVFFKILVALAIFCVLVLLVWFNRVSWFGFDVYRVESVSMLPTLHPNTVVLVNLRSYKKRNPEVNDIVVLLDPLSVERKLIKRVTHIPGQSVSFVQRTNVINETTRTPMIVRNKTTLENIDGYFVQGDNSAHSTDSRQFGVVPLQNIIGKVVFSF